MGRARTKDLELPQNVYLRHGGYYYVTGGRWLNLGRDRGIAIRKARSIVRGRDVEAEQQHPQRFLYVIGIRGAESPVKIGIAADVSKRLLGLQTAHPSTLEIRGCLAVPVAEAARIERRAHRWFSESAIGGEWFNIPFGPVHWRQLIQHVILDGP